MSATLTSTGTWTSLAGATAMDAKQNVPSVNKLDLEALKSNRGVVLPELDQFVAAAAAGWGLTYWQAAGVVEVFLKALMNSEGPTQQTTYTP